MIAKASREETNGSEGIEVLANERFQTDLGEGIYTHKIIHLSKRVPAWLIKLFGLENVLQIEEKSWNMFPYCKTVYKSSLFGDRCRVIVETRHVLDRGESENALDLSPTELKARQLETLDIRMDPNDHTNQILADPKIFKSKKTDRGPLTEDWMITSDPVICAYKVAYVDFHFRAFKGRIEGLILDVMKSIYLRTHRQSYVWMDEWIDLSESDFQQMEDEIHSQLNYTLAEANQVTLSSKQSLSPQNPAPPPPAPRPTATTSSHQNSKSPSPKSPDLKGSPNKQPHKEESKQQPKSVIKGLSQSQQQPRMIQENIKVPPIPVNDLSDKGKPHHPPSASSSIPSFLHSHHPSISSSSSPVPGSEPLEGSQDLYPPPRRLRSRLSQIKNKIRAKL